MSDSLVKESPVSRLLSMGCLRQLSRILLSHPLCRQLERRRSHSVPVFSDRAFVGRPQPVGLVHRGWASGHDEAALGMLKFRSRPNSDVVFSKLVRAVQQFECDCYYPMLNIWVAWNSERPTQREITPETAGRRGALYLTLNGAKSDSGDAFSFENVSERTHGTRAQGSNRR